MTPFAQVLRRDRKRRHMSQAELADFLEVFQQTVSGWETGRVLINEEQKKLLLQVLGPDSELAANLDKIDFETLSCEPKRQRIRGKLRQEWIGLTLAEALKIKEEFKDNPLEMINVTELLLWEKNS
jgi:transcriptional regulator with XRE-family HTH domain